MDSKERRIKGIIREGLILATNLRIKATQNPYACLNEEEFDHKQLNQDAEVIYKHLVDMEII